MGKYRLIIVLTYGLIEGAASNDLADLIDEGHEWGCCYITSSRNPLHPV